MLGQRCIIKIKPIFSRYIDVEQRKLLPVTLHSFDSFGVELEFQNVVQTCYSERHEWKNFKLSNYTARLVRLTAAG